MALTRIEMTGVDVTTTDLISHAVALLLGLLLGAIVDWENIRDRFRRRSEDGYFRFRYAALALLVALCGVVALLGTPLDLVDIARWRGIRICTIVAGLCAATVMAASLIRQRASMTRRVKGIGTSIVVLLVSEAYFQAEAFVIGVPITGLRNLILCLAALLVLVVQLVDWSDTDPANPPPSP